MLAAFARGGTNSKECPPSYIQVKTEAECKSLAAIGNKLYGGSVNVATVPSGCFWLTIGRNVYLNTHENGLAHVTLQLLCAGTPNARTAIACVALFSCIDTPRLATAYGACRQAVAPTLRVLRAILWCVTRS